MGTKTEKPNAIEKALDILTAFTPHNQELGTLDISKRLGLHKATSSRILLTLTRKGFLYQNPETKKFSLGPSALRVGRSVMDSLRNEIILLAKPYIDQLRSDLNETVAMEQFVGDSTAIVYIAEGHRRHRMAGDVGEKIPINAAAGAKAILAYSDPEFVKSLIGGKTRFDAYTPNSITDPAVLMRQLEEVRLKGFSTDCEEIDPGINAIGLPIFNHDNMPVAALVVVGPANRVTSDENSPIVHLARQTAKEISSVLMHVMHGVRS